MKLEKKKMDGSRKYNNNYNKCGHLDSEKQISCSSKCTAPAYNIYRTYVNSCTCGRSLNSGKESKRRVIGGEER